MIPKFCVTERESFLYAKFTDLKMNFPKSTKTNLKNSAVNPSIPGLLEFFIFF